MADGGTGRAGHAAVFRLGGGGRTTWERVLHVSCAARIPPNLLPRLAQISGQSAASSELTAIAPRAYLQVQVIVVRSVVGRSQHSAEALAGALPNCGEEALHSWALSAQLPAMVMRRPSASTKPETSIALPVAWAERRDEPAMLRHE